MYEVGYKIIYSIFLDFILKIILVMREWALLLNNFFIFYFLCVLLKFIWILSSFLIMNALGKIIDTIRIGRIERNPPNFQPIFFSKFHFTFLFALIRVSIIRLFFYELLCSFVYIFIGYMLLWMGLRWPIFLDLIFHRKYYKPSINIL